MQALYLIHDLTCSSFDYHYIVTERKCLCAFWRKYYSIDTNAVKNCHETSLIGSFSVFPQPNNNFSPCRHHIPHLYAFSLPAHCSIHSLFASTQSISLQFLNSSIDCKYRKYQHPGVVLQAKQQLWAKINMLRGLNEIMSVKVPVH